MRRSRAGIAAVTVTAAVSVVLAGCAQQSNQGTGPSTSAQPSVGFPETADLPSVQGKPGGTFRLGISEPTSIDPYNAQESEGSLVTKAIFTGLVDAKPDGTVIPGVATKWTPNADCTEWTFELKPNTTFSNGEPVDAASFKRGWDRTTAKASASQVAYHLSPVKGYKEMQDGTGTTLTGVDATNPNQLKVSLAEPECEFAIRTMHPALMPVPSVAGAADNKAYNDLPIGNGPFKMAGPWEHNKGIKLVRNDSYGAGQKAFLDAVEITITPDANGYQAETDGFNNGQFDWARMNAPVYTQERAAKEPKNQWISKITAGIDYLVTSDFNKPLDSVKARKAVSLAIDRNTIAQGIFQGSKTPATSIIPKMYKGAAQLGVCDACKFDPAQAKQLAQEAGLTPGTVLKFQFNTGASHEEWTAAVKQQVETTLGLKVELTGVPFRDLLENQRQPTFSGMTRLAWSNDYPTAANILGPLLSTGAIQKDDKGVAQGDNKSRYSNPKVDEMLAKAAASPDSKVRDDLYKQVEKIAIGDDLAWIPMFVRQQYRLANTEKFGNVKMDFFENPTLAEITLK